MSRGDAAGPSQRAAHLRKRSFTLSGHRTSLALEPDFWAALEAIAKARALTLAQLVNAIDEARPSANLSSALRCYALAHYRDRAEKSEAAATL